MKSNVKAYTDEQLLDRVKKLKSFDKIPSGRWLLGVRSNEDAENLYDDKIYEFDGETFVRVVSATTNPGLKILKGGFRSFNKDGAAILKSDEWYYDTWEYGLHRGKMPALLQLGGKVKVHRDGDMDGKSEEHGKTHIGYFGINIHTNTYVLKAGDEENINYVIGSWSAGCQVINNVPVYIEMMEWYKQAKQSGKQKRVTYCLINEF